MSELNLLELPLDILVNILKKLRLNDLRNVMLTCKSMRELILHDNSIWRTVTRKNCVLQDRLCNRGDILSWYNRCRISSNWCKGIYRKKILLNHSTNYMPWLIYYKSEVLLLSTGSELKCYPVDGKGIPICRSRLWNVNVPIIKRYDKRTNDISRFVAKNDLIACGNRDGCVSVYTFNPITENPTLLFHLQDCHANGTVEISDVELITKNNTNYLITASESDPTLNLYKLIKNEDTGTYEDFVQEGIIKNLLPKSTGYRCISVNDAQDSLVIAPYDVNRIAVYDLTTMSRVNTTSNEKHVIRDIGWHDENTVMLVTHGGRLLLIDTRTGGVVYHARDPFYCTSYCVKSDGGNAFVVGSAEYSRCVLFDSRNSCHHVQIYFTQKNASPVYSLDFDSTKLITASDRSVAVLNFNVNAGTTKMHNYSQWCEVNHNQNEL